MKKYSWLFALFCVIALLFAIGCDSGSSPSTKKEKEEEEEEEETKSGLALEITTTDANLYGQGIYLLDKVTGFFTLEVGDKITVTGEAIGAFTPVTGFGVGGDPNEWTAPRFNVWGNGNLNPSQPAYQDPRYIYLIEHPISDKTKINCNAIALKTEDIGGGTVAIGPFPGSATGTNADWVTSPFIVIQGAAPSAKFRIDEIKIERGATVIWSLEKFFEGKSASDTALDPDDLIDDAQPLRIYGAASVKIIIAE